MDFKHLIISTGAVNVLSNAKKKKSQGNILQGVVRKKKRMATNSTKQYGLFIANWTVNIEQQCVVGKFLVLATLLRKEKKNIHHSF